MLQHALGVGTCFYMSHAAMAHFSSLSTKGSVEGTLCKTLNILPAAFISIVVI